jgi:DNA-binding response OmpR family regulator
MKKILIIDDEFQNREMLSDFLEIKGYEVISANNGAEGLEAFKKDHADAAIIDIKMPVMNGIDCALAIRKIKEHFPIIMITGHVDIDYKIHIKNIGLEHLLIKPLNINEIDNILRSFFE